MKVIRHQYISDQFAGPVLIEFLKLIQESYAESRHGKNRNAVKEVTGNKVKCSWQIEVRPFASHVRKPL